MIFCDISNVAMDAGNDKGEADGETVICCCCVIETFISSINIKKWIIELHTVNTASIIFNLCEF